MAEEQNAGKQHDQEVIKPEEAGKDELAEKDLDKASGGYEKWITFDHT